MQTQTLAPTQMLAPTQTLAPTMGSPQPAALMDDAADKFVARITLPDEARDALFLATRELPNPYTSPRPFVARTLPALAANLGADLAEVLAFGADPAAPGALLIDNLPVDPHLPATPTDGEPSPDQSSFVGEACVLGLAKLIGEPVGYETEKSGRVIHNLVPVAGAEITQSNRGSKVLLNFHNDSVYDESLHFHRFNPDFIILYCHRPDVHGEAVTHFVDARKLVDVLDTRDIDLLRSPLFRMAAPSNFTMLMNKGEKIWSQAMPVLTGRSDCPEITIAANGVEALDDAAAGALSRLYEACRDPLHRQDVALRHGQALLINNRKGVHARSAFNPTFGPHERWLLRANVRRDIWGMRGRWTGRDLVFA